MFDYLFSSCVLFLLAYLFSPEVDKIGHRILMVLAWIFMVIFWFKALGFSRIVFA